MRQVVNSIMEIHQLQSDKFPLDYEMFELEKLVEEGLELQRTLAITRGITLSISMPSSLPGVWADRTLIERTLRNLVGNALKFTPTGGKVQVTVREIDALRGKNPTWQKRLLVETSDTGAGIPPALRDRLFQKFAAGTQRERGHGLGLAFCKMAIEAHGEQIWFDEHLHPPFNTTFAFTVCPFSEGKDHAKRH